MSLINIPSSPKQSSTPKDTSQISINPLSISVTCQLDLDDDASSAFKVGIKKPFTRWRQAIRSHYTETAIPWKTSFVLMLRHRSATLC